MEFTVERSNLLDVLQVAKIVGRGYLPITEGVLLNVNNGSLEATCTDLETVYSRRTVLSSSSVDGSSVIPAKKLLEMIRQMSDVLLGFSFKDNFVTIKYGQNSVNLKTYNPDEYPEMPKTKPISQFKISNKDLQKAIRVVVPAVSDDNSRPVMTGILFEINEKNITLCATDTYRIHVDTVDIETGIDDQQKIIVPGKNLTEIQGLKNDVTVCICDSYVVFSDENASITTRLIAGQYPDYKAVIPHDFTTKVKLDAQEVISALSRAKLIAEEKIDVAIVRLSISDSVQIAAESESGEIKENLETAQILSLNGPLNINFNVKYLMSAIKSASDQSKEVLMKLNTPRSSCVVAPTEGMGLCLIMPTINMEAESTKPEE